MNRKYDYIIIGSGFGGSVSALRLAEKGYQVAVIEQGKRYRPKDFPKSNWNLRKYLWFPQIGLYGIQALTLLKDVFIFHGAGVGGGSLVYANNLLIPPDDILNDPAWGQADWKTTIMPYYQKARHMLGATPAQNITVADKFLKECAADIGKEDTFHINDVGIYYVEPNVTVPHPYIDGKGPDRTGCTSCGGCMTGCRYSAKNTLDLNYLYLAEQLGVKIFPDRQVVDVLPAANTGYTIKTRQVSGFFRKREDFTTRGVFFSAGVMGTVKLLHKCKANGSLPHLSLIHI